MSSIERVGVSLDEQLLERFDKMISMQGYTNRSEAIRDLIRDRLSAEQLQDPQAEAMAAILLVYDHHSTNLSRRLMELQHDHLLQIITSTHVHLDHHNCLEVIILKGKVKDIEILAGKMISLKGVKLGKLNIMSAGV